MKDILKRFWEYFLLRIITISVIILGISISTNSYWIGFFIACIGWTLNFQFYDYRSPNQNDNDKDDFNLQEPYFD